MYFDGINNVAALRREYRKLAKINHPDRGGDYQIMQEINREYAVLSRSFTASNSQNTSARNEKPREDKAQSQVAEKWNYEKACNDKSSIFYAHNWQLYHPRQGNLFRI